MGEPRKNADSAAIEEASNWFALLRSGAASEKDRRAFDIWRNADPRNADAYENAVSIWTDIGDIEELKASALAVELAARRPAGRSFLAPLLALKPLGFSVAALALIVVVAAILWRPAWLIPNVYETRTAEIEHIELPDGSAVDLGPKTRIRIAYSNAARRVVLKRGEAFFDVRKGEPRAFIVASGGAEIRVTGTRFNVHQGPTAVTVAVAEGHVEVRRATRSKVNDSAEGESRELSAGEQVAALIGGQISMVAETPPSTVGAWRAGRLDYDGASLRDVIADANRYSRIPIVVAGKKLLDLKIVASFRTNEIDEMIDGLPEILPLMVDRSRKDRLVLRPAEPDAG